MQVEVDVKHMQVEVDVKHMQANFGGCGCFGFRDFAPFCLPSNLAKFSFPTMDYSPWSSKKVNLWELAQKIHASRDGCQVHACQFWWVWSL